MRKQKPFSDGRGSRGRSTVIVGYQAIGSPRNGRARKDGPTVPRLLRNLCAICARKFLADFLPDPDDALSFSPRASLSSQVPSTRLDPLLSQKRLTIPPTPRSINSFINTISFCCYFSVTILAFSSGTRRRGVRGVIASQPSPSCANGAAQRIRANC